MNINKSTKRLIIFWVLAIIFLVGLFFCLQIRNGNFSFFSPFAKVLPAKQMEGAELVLDFAEKFSKQDNQEKTFLVLFQNNMEIRPGGGFIGSFGILKIKNGKITETQVHDTANFDGRIPDTVVLPYPMQETLNIKSWKFRDSNYSPDFPTNAKKAQEFYYMGQGQETFDGIVGLTANVLTSLLKVTGPIQIPGYPGTYGDENAVITLETQVERGYIEQGIKKGDRKSVLNDLAKAILSKISSLSISQKISLANIVLEDLNKKDIQLYFKDQELQNQVKKSNWAGEVDQAWKKDYLMAVDANLGAYKSDYYVKRSLDYSVDLSGEIPKAVLKITYNHTAKQKDWMTNNYTDFLRVYVPSGSWLDNSKNFDNPKFGKEFNKTYFGAIVGVPIGQTKTVELEYTLPKEIKDNYDLKIQKQAGLNDTPVAVHIKNARGETRDYSYTMNSDLVLNK